MTERRHTDAGEESNGERTTYQWDGQTTPGVAVVEAVAAATGRGVTALPPLHDALDVDAMNALLGSAGQDAAVMIEFEYADLTVVIDVQGTITVDA